MNLRFSSALLFTAAPLAAAPFTFQHENVLGTSLEIRVEAVSESDAAAAEARVLAEVDRLTAVLSTWQKDSEISRWLSGPPEAVTISADLYAVLSACDAWEQRSGGAFNPRVEILTQLWKRAAAQNAEPSAAEISAVLEPLRAPAWRLLRDGKAQRLGDAPITVSALAKGYIIQHAGALASDPARGVSAAMLNIGGDIQTWGSFPADIANPHAAAENDAPLTRTLLRSQALATSGGYLRGTDAAGRHRSHIFDPRTGQPAEDVLSASVTAPDATAADALATICCVLSPEESLALIAKTPGTACLLMTADRIVRSPGWHDAPGSELVQTEAKKDEKPAPLVALRTWTQKDGKTVEAALLSVDGTMAKLQLKDGQPAEVALASLSDDGQKLITEAQAANWHADHELLISYEINNPGGGRYNRPYVAVWIEDKDGFPLRTLTLFIKGGTGGKWLPDLKQWYRSEKLRKTAEGTELIPTVSGATKNPGAYTALWDGKDNAGAPVKPGTYTLLIEAAREHGTYQLMKKEITVGGADFQEKLEGNKEIKSAALDYRKKQAK